ncbi:unnamed protein product [Lactuca saligna]|uniref:MULE transposase domain-containing protein n=1 Tax=Lactuca saligna TaxID=75948 RepID=A0AA35YNS0_LACSI|nr:unnamed protein product [Lactuca saligna]
MFTKEYEQICSTYLIDKAIESSNDLTIGTSISTLNDGNHESEDSYNVLTIGPSKITCNDGDKGKENYSKFSNVISMDATYRINRYNMIFVPFTAINNHEKTINVGAGLISDETIESYTCKGVSRMYSQIMYVAHNVKNAIKIEPGVVSNSDFKKRINQLVWNMNIEPS